MARRGDAATRWALILDADQALATTGGQADTYQPEQRAQLLVIIDYQYCIVSQLSHSLRLLRRVIRASKKPMNRLLSTVPPPITNHSWR